MKILYAIQGTGNGHLARGEDIVPILKKYGELDLFVSGAQVDIQLPYPVKYRSKGVSFYFGKNGGVNFAKTLGQNSVRDIYREFSSFPVEKYDLVINDFEAITAWACRKKKIPCVALSHQSALLSRRVPRPRHYDPMGALLLKYYAPARSHTAFHFKRYDEWIYTPVIRSAVRRTQPEDKGHFTVYLPAYDDTVLVPFLSQIPVAWHIFSKHSQKEYTLARLSVFPVDKERFAESMVSSRGVLCGAGFETPAEALYLGKRLLVVPMKNQYEQHFNAAALKDLGVPVLYNLKRSSLAAVQEWVDTAKVVSVRYDDIREDAVRRAVEMGKKLTGR